MRPLKTRRSLGPHPEDLPFRTDAKNGECLKLAGFNFLSLANNHTLDYEYEALFDMLAHLDKAGVHHGGAGSDVAQASLPVLLTAGGKHDRIYLVY